MADQIEVRGVRALGIIGVCPEEQVRPQPFEVDFDVETDVSLAAETLEAFLQERDRLAHELADQPAAQCCLQRGACRNGCGDDG